MNKEQLLIFYMYQQGYTEEDMYDELALKSVRNSMDFLLYDLNYQMKPLIDAVKEMVSNVWAVVKKAFLSLRPLVEEFHKGQQSLEEPREKFIKPHYSNNYARFSHQVNNRKPRHINRKIIR